MPEVSQPRFLRSIVRFQEKSSFPHRDQERKSGTDEKYDKADNPAAQAWEMLRNRTRQVCEDAREEDQQIRSDEEPGSRLEF